MGSRLDRIGCCSFFRHFCYVCQQRYKDWDSASNYIGISSPTVNIDASGWFGGGKSVKNGITQDEPVVKPKSDTDGGGKGKEDDSFHPGQSLPNFKADVGFDILKFKGLHYGVPEFESSWMTGGAITPTGSRLSATLVLDCIEYLL